MNEKNVAKILEKLRISNEISRRARIGIPDLPKFTAHEVNELAKRALRNDYYKKAHKFVLDYLDGRFYKTEKSVKWLWGIKNDLL